MNAQTVLLHLRPDAIPNEDYFASGDRFKWIGRGDPPTDAELKAAEPAALAAQQAEQAKRIESDTARSEAKQAYSELQPLRSHKDPAIALLADVMCKHLIATLGR